MNCVVIPTYRPHFKHVEKLIQSMNIFSKDSNIDIYIIVTSNESSDIMITKYNNLTIKILCLKDIIHFIFNSNIDEHFNNHYGKFTYQSLKKIFSVYYVINKLNYKNVYVLDSEGLFIRPFSLTEIINNYIKNPRIFYNSRQRLDSYQTQMAEELLNNNEELLNNNKCPGWFLENYLWIYEDVIVNNFFTMLFHDICDTNTLFAKFKNSIFIEVVYYHYIFLNNYKFSLK